YTDAQVSAMLERCRTEPTLFWLAEVITGLAYTGLRIGELLQLRWSAVDLEANMLRIIDNRSTAARGRIKTSTKSHASRQLPIHPDLRRTLDELPRHPDGRVFHAHEGEILRPDKIRKIFIRDVLGALATRFPAKPGDPGIK